MATPTSELGTGSDGEQTRDTIESLKQELSRVSGQVQDYLKDRAQNISDKVQDQTTQVSETVQERIRENPLAAIGIAAGVGFAMGLMMLGRRRSSRESRGGNGWARSQDFRNWSPRDMSRGDLRRLTAAIREGFEQTRSHSSDPALLEKLSGALSNLLNSPAASSMASAGTRAARQFVDRLAGGR